MRPLFTIYVIVAFALFWDAIAFGAFPRQWVQGSLLVVGCIGIAMLAKRRASTSETVWVVLLLIGVALITLRTVQMVDAVREDRFPTIDIGQTTIAAVDAYAEGRNPYTEPIDGAGRLVDPDGRGLRYFGGFKYGPAMTWLFVPAVRNWGANGLFVMNWLGLAVTAAAAAAWTFGAAGRTAAAGAAVLVLVPRFLDAELFTAGVTDLVPVALAIGALALGARRQEVAAGALLGLSIATKLLPGLLFAVALLAAGRQRARMALAMVVTAIVPFVPFLIDSPRELVANLVIFNLERPFTDTSALHGFPSPVAGITSVLCFMLSLVLLLSLKRRGDLREVKMVAATITVALGIFLFGGKAINRNYFFWVLPVAATAVATAVWPMEPRADVEPASDEGGREPQHP
ncbi:MAG: glycosyltransferase 87 family protein [Actinomycetota bacterium]